MSSTTSDFKHLDVERSRNVIKQEQYLVEKQKKTVLHVILPVVERSRDDLSIVPVVENGLVLREPK